MNESITSSFDFYQVYRIIRILSTPWDQQPAFKLGIIDKNGNLLKHSNQLKTREEQDAFTLLTRFVFNLKRILEHIPGGKTKIGSYAAALYLLRESEEFSSELNDLFESEIKEDGESFGPPTNNAGGGAIAGIGVGPDGEPPNRKKKRRLVRFSEYLPKEP